jgi:hypothetical protein
VAVVASQVVGVQAGIAGGSSQHPGTDLVTAAEGDHDPGALLLVADVIIM